MACEHLGIPLATENLHYEGAVYNLDWKSLKTRGQSKCCSLPSADHAIYLINAVKFHCGQLFHLFEEHDFMEQFSIFYEKPDVAERVPDTWYIHLLLIIAFGKALVVGNVRSGSPPGSEFFLEAMTRLPEITLLCTDPIESVEILVCAALYLQCLDFRCTGYNLVGQVMKHFEGS